MIAEVGQFALSLALIVAIVQAVLPMIGAQRGDAVMMSIGYPAALSQLLLVGLAFAALTYAFVVSDFSLATVASNSHSLKPMLYKVTGVWANHEGSMLMWVLTLALFGWAVAQFGDNLPPTLRARVLSVQAMIGVAFLAFIIFTSNPFLRLDPAPIDGSGLLRLRDIGWGEPARAGGEQGRVLHATDSALPRGVDDGDLFIRVRTEPLSVVLQRGPRRLEVAAGLPRVLRLQQQPHLDRGQPGDLEPFPQIEEVGAGGPGEVVDDLLDVAVCRGAVGVVPRFPSDAGCAEDPPGGDGDPDVVDAVVGEELGAGVELMTVPARVLEHADLREPLRDEEEVSDCAGSGERSRYP